MINFNLPSDLICLIRRSVFGARTTRAPRPEGRTRGLCQCWAHYYYCRTYCCHHHKQRCQIWQRVPLLLLILCIPPKVGRSVRCDLWLLSLLQAQNSKLGYKPEEHPQDKQSFSFVQCN